MVECSQGFVSTLYIRRLELFWGIQWHELGQHVRDVLSVPEFLSTGAGLEMSIR